MLHFEKLKLTNFGPIQGTKEFVFNKGLNLLCAKNGSGKTSIVSAIEMLTIDNYISSYENYINWNEDFFEIELLFSINSHKYIISLNCKKGKNNTLSDRVLKEYETQEEIARGDNVKEFLSKLIDPVTTKFALVNKQDKSQDSIVKCSDSERRDLFKRIEDVDLQKEVDSIIEEKLEVLKNNIIQIDKEIYRLENCTYIYDPIKDLPFSEQEYTSKKQNFENIKTQKQVLEERNKQYEDKVKEQTKVLEEINSITNQMKNKNEKIDKATKEIENFNSSLETEIGKNEQSINAYTTQLQKKKQDSLDTKNKLQIEKEQKEVNYNEECKNRSEKINDIKVFKLKPFDNNVLLEISKKLAILENDIVRKENDILSFQEGKCPTCGQDCIHNLELSKKEKEELLKQKEIVEQEKENLLKEREEDTRNKENKELKEKLKIELDQYTKEMESYVVTYSSTLQNIEESLLKDIENINVLVQKTKDSLVSFKSNIKVAIEKELGSIEEYKNDLQILETSFTSTSKRHMDICIWLESNKIETFNKENELYDLSQVLDSYNKILLENENTKTRNENLIKEEKANKVLLETKKKEKQGYLQEKYDNEQAKTILLKEFPNYVIESTIENTENEMNQFIENIYYKSLDVNLRSTKTSIKLEYGTGKRKVPVSKLSGAESQIVQLSFINKYNSLLDLRCLFMDEPDAALDDDNKKELYDSILNLSEYYNQLFIITHSEKIKNYLLSYAEPTIIEV
jgi:DNA repair exonuclease SbcCD ATPase subunit